MQVLNVLERFVPLALPPGNPQDTWLESPNITIMASLTLREAIRREGISRTALNEPLTNRFDPLRGRALWLLRGDVGASYHSVSHGIDVARTFVSYLQRRGSSSLTQQIGELAALLHDLGHSGTRYRCDADGVAFAHGPSALTNEEWAALRFVDEFPELNASQLAFGHGLIVATSFGQHPSSGDPAVRERLARQPELARPYRPTLPEEMLLALADVNRTASGVLASIDDEFRLQQELAATAGVYFGELPNQDLSSLISRHSGFLENYVLVLATRIMNEKILHLPDATEIVEQIKEAIHRVRAPEPEPGIVELYNRYAG